MRAPNTRFRALRHAAAIAAVLILCAGAGPAEPAFLDGFEDMPRMPGMRPVPDAAIGFDSAGGRIVVVFAETGAGRAQVSAFYRAALAQLGWSRTAPERYRREGEALSLDYAGDGGRLIVRFSLLPDHAGQPAERN